MRFVWAHGVFKRGRGGAGEGGSERVGGQVTRRGRFNTVRRCAATSGAGLAEKKM